jgi:hypothetical protein
VGQPCGSSSVTRRASLLRKYLQDFRRSVTSVAIERITPQRRLRSFQHVNVTPGPFAWDRRTHHRRQPRPAVGKLCCSCVGGCHCRSHRGQARSLRSPANSFGASTRSPPVTWRAASAKAGIRIDARAFGCDLSSSRTRLRRGERESMRQTASSMVACCSRSGVHVFSPPPVRACTAADNASPSSSLPTSSRAFPDFVQGMPYF